MIAAVGLGITALFGGAPIIAQLYIAMASASGGYILIAWLFNVFNGENFRFGMIGRTGVLDATAAVTYIYLLFSERPRWTAVLMLCFIFAMHFVASPLVGMMQPARERLARALRPICYGFVASLLLIVEIIYQRLFAGELFRPD